MPDIASHIDDIVHTLPMCILILYKLLRTALSDFMACSQSLLAS